MSKSTTNSYISLFKCICTSTLTINLPGQGHTFCSSWLIMLVIHNVSAFTIGNTLTDTWKGVFWPFHHFTYAYVCLFKLARIKISKSNQNSNCFTPKITLKYCWPRIEKNLHKKLIKKSIYLWTYLTVRGPARGRMLITEFCTA